MMVNYKIEVFMIPDDEIKTKPYCWAVLANNQHSNWCNVGHGWSETPQGAWEVAYKYYKDVIAPKEKTND